MAVVAAGGAVAAAVPVAAAVIPAGGREVVAEAVRAGIVILVDVRPVDSSATELEPEIRLICIHYSKSQIISFSMCNPSSLSLSPFELTCSGASWAT